MSARKRAFLMLLLISIIWGAASPVIKYTLDFFDTPLFLTYRFFLSSVLLIPVLLLTEKHTLRHISVLSPSEWFFLILNGLLGSSIELGLLFWGMQYTTSLDSSLIGSASPVLIAIAGFLILKERISYKKRVGLAVAFAGSLILVMEPLFDSGRLFSGTLVGNVLILLSTLVWVAHVIITKRQLRHKLSPLLLTASTFFFGFMSMAFALPFFHSSSEMLDRLSQPFSAHVGVWYMAFISGSLAYYLYQKAEKTVNVSEANIFSYLSPVFTLPLSVFWLHEPLSAFLALGAIVIVTGVAVAEFKV